VISVRRNVAELNDWLKLPVEEQAKRVKVEGFLYKRGEDLAKVVCYACMFVVFLCFFFG
jgi:hypothetical protein